MRVVAVALLALMSLVACGPAPDPEAGTEPLRVAAVTNLALSVPLRGMSAEFGSVETTDVSSPDEFRAMFTSGRADMATMPLTVATGLASSGVDVRLLGVVDASLLKVIGPGEAGWDTLRGQTVHLPFRGDITDLVFTGLAADNGLTPGEDFDLSYGGSLPELVTSISTGRAQFAVLPEHFATMATGQADGVGELLDLSTEWTGATGARSLPASALVIREDLADRRPELVAALRDHFAHATADAEADPDSAAAEISAQTGIPESTAMDLLPRLRVKFLEPGQHGRTSRHSCCG